MPAVTWLVIGATALLLAVERLGYLYAWYRPEHFRRTGARLGLGSDGVVAVERAFYVFKTLQTLVITGWILWFGKGDLVSSSRIALVAGLLLVVAGQALNLPAMIRLGRVGTFYGVRFGRTVPRCDRFPYSVISHPQYIGAGMTVWGILLASRFPAPDWWILPAIQTTYYVIGSIQERYPPRGEEDRILLPSSELPVEPIGRATKPAKKKSRAKVASRER
jgi:methylene-fatty-acyl-phospholipid synthase